jgi:hypothetical protein
MNGGDRFWTVVPVPVLPQRISLRHRVLCAGSCFADTMGERLREFRFNACVNPSGPLFNPASIATLLGRLQSQKPYTESELFEDGGLWHGWDHHGSFSAPSPEQCLSAMNAAFDEGTAAYENLDVLVLTFGTAFVYRHSGTGDIVANCHKQPARMFSRELLSVQEIVEEYSEIFSAVYARRPSARCIVSVSPVRHLRDSPHENLVSKSILVCAVHELEKLFPRLYYFPAYEIMMDELRDYRFYEADMAHPNKIAVDYLWEKFVGACMDEESRGFIGEYEPIQRAMEHKVMKSGEGVGKFAEEQLRKLETLEKKYPGMGFEKERKYFKGLLPC